MFIPQAGRASLNPRPFILLATCLLLPPAYGLLAQSGVRGKVVGPANDEFAEELLRERSLTRYEMHLHTSADPVQPYRLSEKAVIYLESTAAASASYDPPALHPQLNQSQMLFRPLVLPVLLGTTVDFPNNDDLFHNVFSYSQPKEFDLGRYPRGHRRSVRFDHPGVVNVYCDIHSYMYATILVLENPYFAVPEDDGAYSIDHVPPGAYRIAFWHGRKKVSERPVLIEEGKTTVVNFDY